MPKICIDSLTLSNQIPARWSYKFLDTCLPLFYILVAFQNRVWMEVYS